jgi:hypothetical protein
MGLAGPGGPKLLLVGMAMHRKNLRRGWRRCGCC